MKFAVFIFVFFFFNDTATTEIYTLSLHDALPISRIATGIATRGHTRNDDSLTGNLTPLTAYIIKANHSRATRFVLYFSPKNFLPASTTIRPTTRRMLT